MRAKRLDIAETIESAINDWYFEHGKPVPQWKMQKDPQWWTDYLDELEGKS